MSKPESGGRSITGPGRPLLGFVITIFFFHFYTFLFLYYLCLCGCLVIIIDTKMEVSPAVALPTTPAYCYRYCYRVVWLGHTEPLGCVPPHKTQGRSWLSCDWHSASGTVPRRESHLPTQFSNGLAIQKKIKTCPNMSFFYRHFHVLPIAKGF